MTTSADLASMIQLRMQHRLLVTLAALGMFLSANAFAQQASIPDAVVTAQTISQSNEQLIRSYVEERVDELSQGDPTLRQQARDELLDPLERARATASRAFRREYDRALDGALTRLIQEGSPGVAIGAAQVAGALATQGAYSALLSGLEDDRPGVRYASARAMGRLLQEVDREAAVIASQQVDQAIEAMEGLLASERNEPLVALGVMQGLTAPQGDLRNRCLTALARGMSQQIKLRRQGAVTQPVVNTALSAIVTIREELIEQMAGAPNPDFAEQAAILAGHSMAMVRNLEVDATPQNIGPDTVKALGIASEGVALLAHQSLTDTTPEGRIERAIEESRSGRPAALERAVSDWIGQNGRLTRPPYNARADEFS